MNALTIIKAATDLVVSTGTSTVITNIVKATTPADTALPMKYAVKVGTFVLGTMVSRTAAKYVKIEIDEVAKSIADAKKQIAEKDKTQY